MKLYKKLLCNKRELLLIAILLTIAGIAHGYNMFHFPYYENDEGTYMSQAWSVLMLGKLAPYTYWYDHAPAGWLLIALWTQVTGGFFTFGSAVNSGRVFMLVLHIVSSYLLYYIAKKLTGSKLPGISAVLLFSLSPLGIYFQRRVLLDNMMIFWVLMALSLLLAGKLKLRVVLLSALFFGVGVLTKENAVFFAPAFVYVVAARSHMSNRTYAIMGWIGVTGLIISFYFLYALLKGEFFPQGLFGTAQHVSMVTTFSYQLGRGAGMPFWSPKSAFAANFREWMARDGLSILLGIATSMFGILLCIKEKSLRLPVLLSGLFWVFLLRGKEVIDFYITPLMPLLALQSSIFVYILVKNVFGNRKRVAGVVFLLLLTIICSWLLLHPIGQYTRDETKPQIEATDWIKTHVPSNANIAIDNYDYVDLHVKRFAGDTVMQHADWFWKLQSDTEIRNGLYHNDWKNIQYIALSHEMVKQLGLDELDFLKNAFLNSHLLIDWSKQSTAYRNLTGFISTNGDWMSVYKVDSPDRIILSATWRYYKQHFIVSYGQVIDPSNNFSTTSEGQSYALLRAVMENDKDTFKGIIAWTKDHLQYREHDKLFSWLWMKKGKTYELGDSASASDADEDIALSLLFAYKRWGNEAYLTQAKQIIGDIWKKEVVYINGHYYLTAGSGAERPDGYLVNPSYLSPATYRIFAQVDSSDPWTTLADDNYYILNRIGSQNGNPTYLPQNWLLIEKGTGEIQTPMKYISDSDATAYGFDAFRTMWRISLDAAWFHASGARVYLQKVYPFFKSEWEKNKKIAAVYELNGSKKVSYESLSTDIGALSVFTLTDQSIAKSVYTSLLGSTLHDSGYWGNSSNYYDQNWAWFGTALYTNNLPDLWANKQ